MTDHYEGRAITAVQVTLFGVECYLPSSIAEAVEQACAAPKPDAVADETGVEFFAVPEGLHPNTTNLVARFASALAEKLAAAERKYGYNDNWARPDWMDECRQKLAEHVAKGDPRDVAAYAAFLWHHGESTAGAKQPDAVTGLVDKETRSVARQLLHWGGVPVHVTGTVTTSPGNWRLIDTAQAQPKRRRYDPNGSLSEYGIFPECDAQPLEGQGDK